MKYPSFPFGAYTKNDFENIPFNLIRPNEMYAMVENYYKKEVNFIEYEYDRIMRLGGLHLLWDKKDRAKYSKIKKYVVSYSGECWLDLEDMVAMGREKNYDSFCLLTKEEVDDMMCYYKAYQATKVAREVKDFYNPNNEVVCYVNHRQIRELNWLATHKTMVYSMLNDYEEAFSSGKITK